MHSEDDRVIIVGGFHEVIELAEECGKDIVGLVDPHLGAEYLGYPVLGTDADAAVLRSKYPHVPVFVSVDDPEHRSRLVSLYAEAGFAFTRLVHPQAKVSRTAILGAGVMVQYGAHLSASVRLDDHVRINVYANVMHDVTIGKHTTVGPNALILGRVRIHEGCYIGAHSTIMPDLEIGERSCVGAHANVTASVSAGSVVVGNPARPHRP